MEKQGRERWRPKRCGGGEEKNEMEKEMAEKKVKVRKRN